MIETERFLLRPHEPGDFEAYYAMSSDPVPYAPVLTDRRTGWTKFLAQIGHWAAFGYGDFAVIEKGTGRYLGVTGLVRRERGLGAGFDDFDEAAWWFVASDRGTGIGAEATPAMQAWYDARRGPVRTVCIIAPQNEASLRIAARLGYREYDRCEYGGDETVMLERVPAA
jgi:RimJ/RimL family protein N-acetyltransferase